MVASNAGREHRIRLGFGHWRMGTTTLFAEGGEPATQTAGSYAWTADDTLTMQVRFIETPHALVMIATFDGDAVEVSGRWNVAFWPEAVPLQRGSRT